MFPVKPGSLTATFSFGLVLLFLLTGCATSKPSASTTPAPVSTNTGAVASSEPLRFVITVPTNLHARPINARVLLFLSRLKSGEPRQTSAFSLDPEPVFALDATNWAPGATQEFIPARFRAPDALAYPGPLDQLEAGLWRAQALVDLDPTERDFNRGPGNLYSQVSTIRLDGARGGIIQLVADQVIKTRPTEDTEWVKVVEVRSRLLSEFHGRETRLRAAVILPAGFTNEPARKYPALYVVPGFGGRHTSAFGWMDSSAGRKWKKGEVERPMLRVVLDPDVPLGHSVFANSANNGPVGDALVQELIPEIERRFRAIPEARGRLVTGHSSGGWSSLWLQVAYPDFFGGCWSTAPDPVDFRAFQTMNIYEDRNAHWTREGLLRPLARSRHKVTMHFQQMNLVERVLGYGGQLDSFDAVFSPRAADGRPKPLINKLTGTLDRTVADYWKRYDIRLLLEENWPTLGPKLQGKIHVIAGAWDTFYLNPATELLQDFLATRQHGGYVEILPGDHGSVLTEAVRERMAREIAEQLKRSEGGK